MTILLYIIYCVYHTFSGLKDSVLWSRQGANAFSFDIHPTIFTPERVGVYLSIIATAFLLEYKLVSFTEILIVIHAAVFSFPFFHNGSYFKGRESIDGSYDSWFSFSREYKGFWNFRPLTRTILFAIGVIATLYATFN